MNDELIKAKRRAPGRPGFCDFMKELPAHTTIKIVLELVGGIEVVKLLAAYHEHRKSIRQIAEIFHLDRCKVHRQLREARRKLRKHNLLPASWEWDIDRLTLVRHRGIDQGGAKKTPRRRKRPRPFRVSRSQPRSLP